MRRYAMGLFSKSVTDEKWINQAKSPYQNMLHLTTALHKAINSGSIEDEYKAVDEFSNMIPIISEATKQLQNPTSKEACRAHKNLKSAVKIYTEAIKHGVKYFKALCGESGRNLSAGGVLERFGAATIGFEKSIYRGFIKTAQGYMDEADAYLSNYK